MHRSDRKTEKIKYKKFYFVFETSNINLKTEANAEMPSLFPELEALGCYVIQYTNSYML